MPSPTLVIGLGGTGDWVLTHVYHNLKEQYRYVPEEVKLLLVDTDNNPGARAQFNGVKLPEEFILSIGGPVSDLTEQISSDANKGRYPELSSWYQAKWFSNIGGAVLNLQNGASQFRQLGRLSVFDNFRTGGQSLVANLEKQIGLIRKKAARTLMVCLVGSLCGGSGSGMFIDVAHLIRRTALKIGYPDEGVMLRGFLVLPQAWEGTLHPGEHTRGVFRARAFAALRELERFSGTHWPKGTPIVYDRTLQCGEAANDVLAKALFEALYLVDGRRSENSLETIEIGYGVSPLIADVIGMLIDGQAADMIKSYRVNIESARANHPEESVREGAPTTGTMGGYSLIWPWDAVVKEWAYRLTHELLEQLNEAERFIEGPHRPTDVRDDRSGGEPGRKGADEASELSSADQFGGKTLERSVQTVLEWRNRHSTNPQKAAQDYRAQSLDSLLESFRSRWEAPSTEESGFDALQKVCQAFLWPQKREKAGGARSGLFGLSREQEYARVQLPGKAYDKSVAAKKLIEAVRRFSAGYLGMEEGGERRFDSRNPAEFPTALYACAQKQEQHFSEALETWLSTTLNGSSPEERDAVYNRGGKVGYALSYLRQLTQDFQAASTFIQEQVKKRRDGGMPAIRVRIETAEAKMSDDKRQQEEYLKAWQERLELEEWLWAGRMQVESARRLAALCREYVTALESWIRALYTDVNSTYACISEYKSRIERQTATAEELKEVRVMVRDKGFEDQCYNEEVEDTASRVGLRNHLLDQLTWEVICQGDKRQIRLKIEDKKFDYESSKEIADRLINVCRDAFDTTKDRRSLLHLIYYQHRLTHESSPEDREKTAKSIVTYLSNRYTPLLALMENTEGIKFHQDVYLRWFDDPEDAFQPELRRMLSDLLGGKDTTKLHHITFLPSEDRFRLFCSTFYDLIPYNLVMAYNEGFQVYRNIPQTCPSGSASFSREIAHILPGEVQAARYERLGPNTTVDDLLHVDIVDGLNDPVRFQLFEQAYIYGAYGRLLSKYTIPADNMTEGRKMVWRLVLLPPPGGQDSMGQDLLPTEYWLTSPDYQSPSLVQALKNFVLTRMDYKSGQNIDESADKAVHEELQNARAEEWQRREESGTLGNSGSAYRDHLGAVPSKELMHVKAQLGQLDLYRDRGSDIGEEIDACRESGDTVGAQLLSIFLADIKEDSEKIRKELDWITTKRL